MSNRIVAENARTDGRTDRSYWDAAASNQIEGFATDISVNAGQTVNFKINVNGRQADTLPYKVEIFRLGYYGGAGAREVAELTNADGTVQPNPLFDESRGLVDAGNWSITDSWQVPADAVSGVYLARVQRLDAAGNPIPGATNQIPFIVRNDGVAADIVLQTSDTTWHAYNGWAGNNGKVGPNFYGDPADMVDHEPVADPGLGAQDRAYAVSYNRPFITRDGGGAAAGAQDYLFGADYAAISWLEQNGYDVSYISGADTDRQGANYLKNYKAFISVGHDEYWSGDQRANVEAAKDAGVNLLFWSGNEMYWKTRWETAISADGTPYRTLVCYKETWANRDPNAGPADYANIDPTNIWTGTWRDVRFRDARDANGNYIAGGSDPDPVSGLRSTCNCAENSLIGQLFGPDGTGEFGGALDVPASYGTLRVWRNTAAMNGELDIAPGIIGYEWDVVPDDENRPAGLIKLSETTLNWSGILVDQGNAVAPGTATHSLSLYRDPESGALVFGAGTVFWSWGLSDEHDSSPYGANVANALLKQFTVNMFADMGIQPGSLEAGLLAATASPDKVGARATMVDLPDQVAGVTSVLITGTATDNDGNAATPDGMVALVEISFDGGQTWKVAQGTTNWSYLWRPTTQGTYTITVRAIDDSLNVTNLTHDQETVVVTPPPRPTTTSLFDPAAPLPSNTQLFNDGQAVELGMKFTVSEAGTVTQLKYYRSASDAGDTDVREGHLWRASDGALLGTVTFTSTSGQSGWQVASLSNPVALVAGVHYIVSYRTSNNYVVTGDFFVPGNELAFDGFDDNAFTDPFVMVRAPQDTGTGIGGNGVYEYGTNLVAPNNTYRATNYWTDVTFRPNPTSANNVPVFTSGDKYTVLENEPTVGTVTATDANGDTLTYAVVGGVDGAFFNIEAATGLLTFKLPVSYESPADADGNNTYIVRISVTDGLSTAVVKDVEITLKDVNEAPNALELSNSSVAENASAGVVIGTLAGTDPDTGDTVTYTLIDSDGGRFALDGNRLVLAPGAVLNREATASYTITVRVTDAAGLSIDKSFAITVGDVDEFDVTKPIDSNASANVVTEGAAAGSTVGITATATDGDATTNDVVYSLTDNAGGRFVINAITGVVSIASGAVFSVDTPSHQITVLATSADGSTATETFNVAVTTSPRILVTLTSASNTYTAPDNRSYEVQGLGGNDVITTFGGNDLVNGGSGNDTILTGAGQDIVEFSGTTAGIDSVDGGAGSDMIRATAAGTLIRLSGLTGIEQISANGLAAVQVQGTTASNSFDLSGVLMAGIASIDLSGGNDSLIGSAGHDTILGGAGTDTIDGGAGNDVIDGGSSNDVLNGGANDDTFIIGPTPGTDRIDGGTGTDRVEITASGITISTANLINIEALVATGDNVTLSGTSGADRIDHGTLNWSGIRLVDGGGGNDTLIGGFAADRLAGRAGADVLTGGEGADDFVFLATSESRTTTIDTITDFAVSQDNLDLTAIDANTSVSGNQDFTFIGNSAFSNVAGQIRIDHTSFAGQTRVYADVNGDGRADMEIRLNGQMVLTADDVLG